VRRPRFSARREVALGLAVYGVHLLVRAAVYHERGRRRALENGARLAALEARLRLDVEPAVQRALLPNRRLLAVLNAGYALFNVMLTVTVLWRRFRRRDPGFHRLRRAAVLAELGAQPVFLLFPTAPPRALEHVVDTIAEFSGVDLDHPLLVRFYNPIAAMPSIHVAFAVVTARAVPPGAPRALRIAAAAYPGAVAGVVVATGNHYLLDTVAGAALGRLAHGLAGRR
jgi:hypothetical protein